MKLLHSLLLVLFCGPAAIAAQTVPAASADQAEAVKGSNAFAVDLYSQLSAQPGNLFFSPESISTAFAMAYAGAHGQTATEMADTLHLKLPPDRLHPAMGSLLAGMNAPHRDTTSAWLTRSGRSRTRSSCLPTSTWSKPITALDFTRSISRPLPTACAEPLISGSKSRPTTRSRTFSAPAPSRRYPPDSHQRHLLQGSVGRPVRKGRDQKRGLSLAGGQDHPGAHDAQLGRL